MIKTFILILLFSFAMSEPILDEERKLVMLNQLDVKELP